MAATPLCSCHGGFAASPSSATRFFPSFLLSKHSRRPRWIAPLTSNQNHTRMSSFTANRAVRASSGSGGTSLPSPQWGWNLKPAKGAPAPSLSDVIWPSAGAFAAMAALGKVDQILAPKGLFVTIAPLGAVAAVLFATPGSPGAQKYNMFVAQIGCAAIGVLAFYALGPGWLARSAALAASIAFMIYTGATHPPAASLPLLFIDGPRLQPLSFWYALFPGAAGCLILCVIQEIVCYLKDNCKF